MSGAIGEAFGERLRAPRRRPLAVTTQDVLTAYAVCQI
jgi:hypothetical protein